MSSMDVVKQWTAAVEAGDMDTANNLVADDMVFEGPVPEPVGKAEFMGLQGALVAAIPDWSFGATDLSEDGDMVYQTNHITGTHTGTLYLPMLPGPVPATGKSIRLPAERVAITLRGDQVTRISVDSGPGGGVMGLLMQIGVELPPMM